MERILTGTAKDHPGPYPKYIIYFSKFYHMSYDISEYARECGEMCRAAGIIVRSTYLCYDSLQYGYCAKWSLPERAFGRCRNERSLCMEERYSRNIPALSREDMEILRRSRAFVAGCGGLGGFIIEYLARVGIGAITAVDGDVFCESNLNRQLLSRVDNIGEKKAFAAAERVKEINPGVSVRAGPEFLTKENAARLLADADIVMDALDNVSARYILEDAAAQAGLPIIHGAICGWDLQVMLVEAGSGMIRRLYPEGSSPASKTSLPFTPAACAALQVSMAVRRLCGHMSDSDRDLFTGSLRDLSFEPIPLGN